MSLLLTLVILGAVAFVGGFVWLKLFRMVASKDGERLRRIRMQGPFVPLSAEDIAEDEERIRKRRAGANVEP